MKTHLRKEIHRHDWLVPRISRFVPKITNYFAFTSTSARIVLVMGLTGATEGHGAPDGIQNLFRTPNLGLILVIYLIGTDTQGRDVTEDS